MNEPVRRLPLPHTDRARGFAEALQQAKGKHLLIALRGHPDPDGIASALATYCFSAWRLHSTSPERAGHPGAAPSKAPAGEYQADMATLQGAASALLDRVYSSNGSGDGRLSASGLRTLQALRGKENPGILSLALEPAFFAVPLSRARMQSELDAILTLAVERTMGHGADDLASALEAEVERRGRNAAWALRYYPAAAISLHLAKRLERPGA